MKLTPHQFAYRFWFVVSAFAIVIMVVSSAPTGPLSVGALAPGTWHRWMAHQQGDKFALSNEWPFWLSFTCGLAAWIYVSFFA